MAVDVILTDENFTPQQYSVSVGVALSKVGGGTQTFYLTDGTETISDMSVHNVQSKAFAQVVEPNLSAGNIRSGVSILGTVGDYITPGTTKSVTLDFSGGDMSIGASGEELWNQIDIFKPATLIPQNIAFGVTIAGISGTLEAFPAELFENTRTTSQSFVLADKYFTRPITTMQPMNFTSNSCIVGINLSQLTTLTSVYFSQCTRLTFISLPALTSINTTGAFASCYALTSVYLPSVVSIPASTFLSCVLLQSISIPSVQIIGSNAFSNCTYLSSIYAPALSIFDSAFTGCSALQSLTTSEFVKAFGSSTFSGCSMLSTLKSYIYYVNTWATSRTSGFGNGTCTFSVGTTVLASNLLSTCYSMKSVSNLESVQTIGSYAFQRCSALVTAISLPNYIGSIHSYVFSGCWKIPSISIPTMSGAIGSNAFRQCLSLSIVVLGAPTLIDSYAFQSCYNLISLYLFGTSVCTLTAGAFSSSPLSNYSASAGRWGSVFVRASLVDAYKTATNWKSISDRIIGMTDAEIEEFLGGN